MLPFGGFPLREGAHDSEESHRKSHSGTPGSKAACAYPGRYRSLPRPSSALKPSHSPDGVACRAVGSICLAFGENLTYDITARRLWPMHGVIVSFCLAHYTASLRIITDAELHLIIDDIW